MSTSGFYEWRQRESAGPTEREVAEAELVTLMGEIFDASDGNYGVPRMHRELRRAGLGINEKRVRRLMRLHGMAGRPNSNSTIAIPPVTPEVPATRSR